MCYFLSPVFFRNGVCPLLWNLRLVLFRGPFYRVGLLFHKQLLGLRNNQVTMLHKILHTPLGVAKQSNRRHQHSITLVQRVSIQYVFTRMFHVVFQPRKALILLFHFSSCFLFVGLDCWTARVIPISTCQSLVGLSQAKEEEELHVASLAQEQSASMPFEILIHTLHTPLLRFLGSVGSWSGRLH